MDYVRAEGTINTAAFAAHWLDLWRGPESGVADLLSLYALEASYTDPQVPEGLIGRAAIGKHLRTLLASRAEWIWVRSEIKTVLHGFVSYWQASIPVARNHSITVEGACLVHVRENRIARHEVMFDGRRKRMYPPPLALNFDASAPPSSSSL